MIQRKWLKIKWFKGNDWKLNENELAGVGSGGNQLTAAAASVSVDLHGAPANVTTTK